jgi:hypothetical protein
MQWLRREYDCRRPLGDREEKVRNDAHAPSGFIEHKESMGTLQWKHEMERTKELYL